MFLNLLFKAIKADPSEERIRAFIKRLLQVGTSFARHFNVILVFLCIFQYFQVFFCISQYLSAFLSILHF